jgi:hypothetical protein
MLGIAVFLWPLKQVRPLWRRSGTSFKWLLLPYVADCRGCKNIVPCCRRADRQGIRNSNGGEMTKRLLLSVKIAIWMLTTRFCYAEQENGYNVMQIISYRHERITNCKQQSSSLKVSSRSSSHDFKCSLWNLKCHERAHKSLPLITTLFVSSRLTSNCRVRLDLPSANPFRSYD